MAEVVSSTVAEYVAAVSLGVPADAPWGNELAPNAPHGAFRCADDRWVAIAVHSDQEWAALVDAVGSPTELSDARWQDREARWSDREAVDRALADVTARVASGELLDLLRGRSIRATPVLTGADLVVDDHLAARGFFPEVDHPDPDLRRGRIVGLPWRFAGEGPVELGSPPALGSSSVTSIGTSGGRGG
jgi:crotonobetainyl-CoA:carnitine CoA-transferase CaiB-like acyl-CoA transferase